MTHISTIHWVTSWGNIIILRNFYNNFFTQYENIHFELYLYRKICGTGYFLWDAWVLLLTLYALPSPLNLRHRRHTKYQFGVDVVDYTHHAHKHRTRGVIEIGNISYDFPSSEDVFATRASGASTQWPWMWYLAYSEPHTPRYRWVLRISAWRGKMSTNTCELSHIIHTPPPHNKSTQGKQRERRLGTTERRDLMTMDLLVHNEKPDRFQQPPLLIGYLACV